MRRARSSAALLLFLLALMAGEACAAGPRFVTGPPFFTAPAGQPIGWKQPVLEYFTDPGPLSQYVSHAQADALVAAAAAVWNLPVASITVQQGGTLGEEVNGQNVYAGQAGMVFPADVMLANAAAVPVAVLFDADGAITDALLGAGASGTSGCRQNAVTETVDGFDPAGYITHAVIVVNGRCTGPAAAQQTQLKYQLERVFGRVLGLAWSQTNDNVYTGTPTPTYQQALHWPIMHPLDILCGPYTYQCLPQPFTLRPDDIAAMVMVYPVTSPTATREASLAGAFSFLFPVRFPTGEGMAGVNLLGQVMPGSTNNPDAWVDVSAVTGWAFRRGDRSPFVAPDTTPAGSMGTTDQNALANAYFPYVPIVDGLPFGGVLMTSEAVNPLYVGQYSVGPYARGEVAPSGSPIGPLSFEYEGAAGEGFFSSTVADAAATCGDRSDGTPGAPAQIPAAGWWTGLLCGYGHAAYAQVAVTPGRTFTVEVTALDEAGQVTTAKMRPVIGVFAPADAAGTLPTVGVAAEPFNALTAGTTTLTAPTGQLTNIRVGIADQRNDGRPDYRYQARLFYADSITPALVPAGGAQATIHGMGFRSGNVVRVNGLAAIATAWTDTTITVSLPSLAQAKAQSGVALAVVVADGETGATSTMTGVLTYKADGNVPPALEWISVPPTPQYPASQAATPLVARELAADGQTPLAGVPLTIALSGVAGVLSACGAASCTLTTDARGMVSTYVTPAAPGSAVISVADPGHAGVTAVRTSFQVNQAAGSIEVLSLPAGPLYATQQGQQQFAVRVRSAPAADGSTYGMWGQTVVFSSVAGSAVFGQCQATTCNVITDGSGYAAVSIAPSTAGRIVLEAAAAGASVEVPLTALSWADHFTTASVPNSTAMAGQWSGYFKVGLVHGDGWTPDAHQSVVFSGPPEVIFGQCGANPCTAQTDDGGSVQQQVRATQPGTYTIQASFGSLVTTSTFTVLSSAPILTIVSAPGGTLPVGRTAAAPFTVRLTDASGQPVAGAVVAFAADQTRVILGLCNTGSCFTNTDSDGFASTTVLPVGAGSVLLDALSLGLHAAATFTATGSMRTVVVTDQPAAPVLAGSEHRLAVQVFGPDGVTPAANEFVVFEAQTPDLALSCGAPTCRYGTDQNGVVWLNGTATAAGTMSMRATDYAYPSAAATITFTAIAAPVTDKITLASAPSGSSPVGSLNATLFEVQVLLADGVTPAVGRPVSLAVSAGSAILGTCGATSPGCVSYTDSRGYAGTPVTPTAAGVISLTASELEVQGNQITASFHGMDMPTSATPATAAEQMALVSAPGTSVKTGATAPAPFSVRLTLSDGKTPVAGVQVTFRIASGPGGVTFAGCAAASCTVVTDANGLASTGVLGAVPGQTVLTATAPSPGEGFPVPIFSVATTVLADQFSLVATMPQVYLAAGVTETATETATAIEEGIPLLAAQVTWSVTAGSALVGQAQSATVADGSVSAQVTLGPLADGGEATITACLPNSGVCAPFRATGVGEEQLTIAVVSGGTQSIAAGGSFAPVNLTVTDGAGHAVWGATVTVYQTIRAIAGPCPAAGRCPAAPVIASRTSTATTDVQGQVSIQPLVGQGQKTTTEMAFSAGTQGFQTAVLWMGL